MYKFKASYQDVKVIGGEVCMWGELNSRQTHEQKVWMRASVLAERLWNEKIDIDADVGWVARRLVGHAARMRQRGFKVSAVTV